MKHIFRHRVYVLTFVTILIGLFVYFFMGANSIGTDTEAGGRSTTTPEVVTEVQEVKKVSTSTAATTTKPVLEFFPEPVSVVVPPKEPANVTMPPMTTGRTEITMAWMYPGEPACTALEEAKEIDVDILKPEYFLVTNGGKMELMTEEVYGCNGYSKANVAAVKAASKEQYVMVSSSYAEDMRLFLEEDATSGIHADTLVAFVVEERFEGVELDFEDYGGWTPEVYASYKQFLQRLGDQLHAAGKKLMIDVPAVSNDIEEKWYVLRLADFSTLPVDYVVVMAYDYQYDHGVGEPVAPFSWIAAVASFTKSRYMDVSKIVMGIPAYGYK